MAKTGADRKEKPTRVSMEVSNYLVSWFRFITYLRDLQPTRKAVVIPFTKYHGDPSSEREGEIESWKARYERCKFRGF